MADPLTKGSRFAGVELETPNVGDVVEIVEGENLGEWLIVVDLTGFVYAQSQKVHVISPDGEPVWYWDWNVKVVKRRTDPWS